MVDAGIFRRVMGHYPTGVCIVTSLDAAGQPIGMCVGSFTSVSLDPPLVGFLPDRRSSTWARIRDAGQFCVNVLGADQEAVSRRFATPGADRFGSVGFRRSGLGLPILDGVVAWIDCHLHAVMEAGDHFIAVGAVAAMEEGHAGQPLLFHRGTYGRPVAMAEAA